MNAPASAAFVQAVMDRLGVSQPVDLARSMGWTGSTHYNTPNRIGRWLRGSSAPNYEATMEMIDRCGWFTAKARKDLGLDDGGAVAQAVDQVVAEAPKPEQRTRRNRAQGGSKR